jgi:hypothetical protein
VHRLWLRLSERFGSRLHHRDVVGLALLHFERELESPGADETLQEIAQELHLDGPLPESEESSSNYPLEDPRVAESTIQTRTKSTGLNSAE